MIPDNANLTAIGRKQMPAPNKYIVENLLPAKSMNILNFGCGKDEATARHIHTTTLHWCYNYDINPAVKSHKNALNNKYDIILATYVLCVLSRNERIKVYSQLNSLIDDKGMGWIFITVRNDYSNKDRVNKVPGTNEYVTSRGTIQARLTPSQWVDEINAYMRPGLVEILQVNGSPIFKIIK